jgi:hypothetical protein
VPKTEQITYPLMIVAAVGTLWLLFRKSGTNATVQNTTAPIPAFGAIPPLQQLLTAPAQLAQGPAIIYNAIKDPYSVAPGTPQPGFASPSYLTFNMQPLFSMVAPDNRPASKSGCGCGGSCGGSGAVKPCSSCESPCDSIKARYPDGRGGCMVSNIDSSGIPALAAGLNAWDLATAGYGTATPVYGYAG